MKMFLFFLLMMTLSVYAGGDAAKGKKVFEKQDCAKCHGKGGTGNVKEKAPNLAGQYDWYAKKALEDFSGKKRSNPKMIKYLKGLKGPDFADLGAYVSTLSWGSGFDRKVKGNAKKGKKLYKKCAKCHGKKGEGKKSQKAPRIAGQYDWYIKATLDNFKSKKRANKKMYPFIKKLKTKDFADLASYVSTL